MGIGLLIKQSQKFCYRIVGRFYHTRNIYTNFFWKTIILIGFLLVWSRACVSILKLTWKTILFTWLYIWPPALQFSIDHMNIKWRCVNAISQSSAYFFWYSIKINKKGIYSLINIEIVRAVPLFWSSIPNTVPVEQC